MPRAALLSIHARVADTGPRAWEEPPFVQVWGPRYSAFVIADTDLAVFTVGRLPDDARGRRRAFETADRLARALGDERMDVRDAARRVGLHPNALRYAAPTGRFLISWDGARQPWIWAVPAPDVEPGDARVELARRFLHVFGPTTPASFGSWAGIRPQPAQHAFARLDLTQAYTPIGDGWILTADEESFSTSGDAESTRLLPSGDTYYLLQGIDRELLVPEERNRARLWTSRVWPGAVLHRGEIVGTWRRSEHRVTIQPWRMPPSGDRTAIEGEAETLPLPLARSITVAWDDPA